MKILNIHNYHAHPGGMEIVFEALTRLFRASGHTVVELARHNSELVTLGSKLGAFASAIYSPATYRHVRDLVEREQIDVAHVHNLYPQLSTSAIDALYDAGVPVILHTGDYKLTCPTAQHLRNGRPCEKCVTGGEQWAAIHNCRGNRPMSVAYAARNAWARLSGSIRRGVTVYACPTQFCADLLIRAGYPKERVRVVYNYCDLPPADSPTDQNNRPNDARYIAYLGRISPEKGLPILIAASADTGIPVRVGGDPTLMPQLSCGLPSSVTFAGQLSRPAVEQFLDDAVALVVPSVWYEVFGLVCVEALNRGVPVIASDIGGLPEVIKHGETGLIVPPGDVRALASAMRRLWDDRPLAARLGSAGRRDVRQRFTPEIFLKNIESIWQEIVPTESDRIHPNRKRSVEQIDLTAVA